MTSYFQSAWLLMNTMSSPILTFRERPCMPAKAFVRLAADNCVCVRVTSADGIVTEWFKEGVVQETLPNGDKTIFPSKPTYESFKYGTYIMAEFFLGHMSIIPHLRENYFEFHKDGVVIYRHKWRTFLWTPSFPAKEVEGDITYSVCEFDDDDFWARERRDSYS